MAACKPVPATDFPPDFPPDPSLFSRLLALNQSARLAVCVFMSELVNGARIAALIDQIARERKRCPNCEGQTFYRHGFANGLQRYRCRSCGVTFNGLTGTPLAWLRLKDRWLAYCDCLRDPACTVHGAAHKVGVHANTSFRWRHRFLCWAKLDRPRTLAGVAEADETFLLESQKGSRQLSRRPRRHGGLARKRGISDELVNILVARDRGGQTVDFLAGRGALTAQALHAHLLPKLERDIILMSDANPAYAAFAQQAQLRHETADVSRDGRVRGAVHIHNVNAYPSRFKNGCAISMAWRRNIWRIILVGVGQSTCGVSTRPRAFSEWRWGFSTANGESANIIAAFYMPAHCAVDALSRLPDRPSRSLFVKNLHASPRRGFVSKTVFP